jgi:hypothetical protein
MTTSPEQSAQKTRILITIFLSSVLLMILAGYIYYGMYYARQASTGDINSVESLLPTGTSIDYTSREVREKALMDIATTGDAVSADMRVEAMEDALKPLQINTPSSTETIAPPSIPTSTPEEYARRQAELDNFVGSTIVIEPEPQN